MTQKNKLIVGGVIVVLIAYYLYDRNKKMKAVADLKNGADVKDSSTLGTNPELVTEEVKPTIKKV